MKESMWGYYLALLGITVSTVMIMVSNMTTTSQQNYYLLKEVTNAAMIDAIDYGYYREYGSIKINTEKFVENFLRRFSEGISKTNTYKIDFYSIYENPPSVSIRVTSNTGDYNIAGDTTNIDVVNQIDSILEANNTITYSDIFYSIPYADCNSANYISSDSSSPDYKYCQYTNKSEIKFDGVNYSVVDKIKSKLTSESTFDESKIKILDVEFLSILSTDDDIKAYNEMYKKIYNRERTLDDIPEIYEKANYFAKNVKDVKITIKKEDNDKYYLGYGLKFNCDGVSLYNLYRKGTSVSNMDYITESQYNSLLNKSGYEKAPFYGNCSIGIKYKINFYYDNAS